MSPIDRTAAVAAVRSIAADRGRPVDDVTVLHRSNTLVLRLRPADLVAWVAPAGARSRSRPRTSPNGSRRRGGS